MHFSCLVVAKDRDEVDRQMNRSKVKHLLDWDFFQVGGRWTGLLDGYDPDADPNLLEVCSICNGSGLRTDALGLKARRENPNYTCNGCDGKGKRTAWPSQWPERDGDRAPASVIKASGKRTFALVAPDFVGSKDDGVDWSQELAHVDSHKEREAARDASWQEKFDRELDRLGDQLCWVVDYHS